MADTPSKCGYREISTLVENEFTKLLKLAHPKTGQLLYTFVVIGHAEQKEVKCPVTRQKMMVTIPSCEKRISGIISKHCDNTILLTVAENEQTGQEERYIVVRSSNVQEIGSRYPMMPNIIPMGNNGARALHGALKQAIKDQAERDNLQVSAVNMCALGSTQEVSFEDLMDQAKTIYGLYDQGGKANVFATTVEQCLGAGRRISDCTELQIEALMDTIQTLKEKALSLGLL